ncbi:MAG: hypothetical protein WCO23_00920 [bacterium]
MEINSHPEAIGEFIQEKWGLEPQTPALAILSTKAGSLDPLERADALRLLEEAWELSPEASAENARTIDIMEQMSQFSPEEQDLIVSNLQQIQLTDGCNGRCPFCFMGTKKGIEAKYSFSSLEAFFEKYGSKIKRGVELDLYWDSDPFDYQDGEHTYLDVVKLLDKYGLASRVFTSTAIPVGGQKQFVEFALYCADKYFKHELYGWQDVRISIGRHNARRVQSTFDYIRKTLIGQGISLENINAFMDATFNFGARADEDMMKSGDLIKDADPYRDLESPACIDATILSPEHPRSIVLVATTVYNPSGQHDFLLEPGKVANTIPRLTRKIKYAESANPGDSSLRKEIAGRVVSGDIFLDQPRLADGSPMDYEKLDMPEVERTALALSRDCLAFDFFIRTLPSYENIYNGQDLIEKYLRVALVEFEKRKTSTGEEIDMANEIIDRGHLSEEDATKLEYFISLSRLKINQVEFILEASKTSRIYSYVVARLFSQIGKEQVDHLPNIISSIKSIMAPETNDEIVSAVAAMKDEIDRSPGARFDLYQNCGSLTREYIVSNIGFYWGINDVSTIPNWLDALWMHSTDVLRNYARKVLSDSI